MYRSRGRGSGSYPGRGSNRPAPASIPRRDYHEGLGTTALKVLNKPSTGASAQDVQITNLEYLASYNWVEAQKPTIIVPGAPREWIDRPLPFRVDRDTGLLFVDQNGYRVPTAVLLPLFTAVDIVDEDMGRATFDWLGVDFVTDRNGLRKLLRWINGTADKTFRIDMQLAGKKTVLLNRWEEATREPSRGAFGFGFEKATTEPAPGCERSTGHHRIVTYDLNGLKMVVRFEVDACLPPPSNRTASMPTPVAGPDDLADSLGGLNISSQAQARASEATSDRSGINIIHAGSADIAQYRIIELTTRSEKNVDTFDWVNQYPQLFLSETLHHYLGIHVGGRFTDIVKRKLHTPDMRDVEKDAKDSFGKLRRALQDIQDIVVESGERGRLTLLCEGGTLKVFVRQTTESCIPDEIIQRFEQ
ncbi:hypothetical protein NEOLEDRAFT_1097007 [Neolentinus lepideus HHB14362 ss-1]|uniref:Geranylgeranyl pyrophosphate synthetase n=1 Tax=Neolentinus lepideus HHB14362 ss-1 TaxID=1314782 RepID=A0A165QSL0_9AGAM|nr:hypothetical protein NEOLEDRAFT_1097007 [Neolentinus lepideus HHB14362 ss-1]